MKKILTIVGARPQFIKAAVLSEELVRLGSIKEVMVHTGQHYDEEMSEIFFKDLPLPKPDYNLGIAGGSHGEQTGRMIIELEKVMRKEAPDLVVVYGDTNSTLAGALAAAKLSIPIAHVEAGFRCHDKTVPEELNRVVTDHVSSLLFCPTPTSMKELEREGLCNIAEFTGDIMYDAALRFSSGEEATLERHGLEKDKYLFVTVHRAANTDDKEHLKSIFDAMSQVKEHLVFPLHPRTKKRLEEFGLWERYHDSGMQFTKPLPYKESLALIKNAWKVVTDSGGVLREAYFFKKTCIILRDSVEFSEAVTNGEAILAGHSTKAIVKGIESFTAKGEFEGFFGKGDAAKKIAQSINNYLHQQGKVADVKHA